MVIGHDVPLLVDDEPRARPRRGLVAEESPPSDSVVMLTTLLLTLRVNQDVLPLLRIQVLEHILGRGRSRCPGGLDRRRNIPAAIAGDLDGQGRGPLLREPRNLNRGSSPPQPQPTPKRNITRVRVTTTVTACAAIDRPSDVRSGFISVKLPESKAWPAIRSAFQALDQPNCIPLYLT